MLKNILFNMLICTCTLIFFSDVSGSSNLLSLESYTIHFLLGFTDIVLSDFSAIRISEAELRTRMIMGMRIRFYWYKIANGNCAFISDIFFYSYCSKIIPEHMFFFTLTWSSQNLASVEVQAINWDIVEKICRIFYVRLQNERIKAS